jgi:hypothetical protein
MTQLTLGSLRQPYLKSATALGSRGEAYYDILYSIHSYMVPITLIWLICRPFMRPNTQSTLRSIAVMLTMTLLIARSGWADERPRNVTLIVYRTEASQHVNGRIDTVTTPLEIYYGSDGTAYVQLGLGGNGNHIGAVIPPNRSSGYYSTIVTLPVPPPQRITLAASLEGQMPNLNIMVTMNMCDADGSRCFQSWRGFRLQVSGATCTVVGGTYNAKSDDTAPNPTVSTSIVGAQTCSIQPGRQLGG